MKMLNMNWNLQEVKQYNQAKWTSRYQCLHIKKIKKKVKRVVQNQIKKKVKRAFKNQIMKKVKKVVKRAQET